LEHCRGKNDCTTSGWNHNLYGQRKRGGGQREEKKDTLDRESAQRVDGARMAKKKEASSEKKKGVQRKNATLAAIEPLGAFFRRALKRERHPLKKKEKKEGEGGKQR